MNDRKSQPINDSIHAEVENVYCILQALLGLMIITQHVSWLVIGKFWNCVSPEQGVSSLIHLSLNNYLSNLIHVYPLY